MSTKTYREEIERSIAQVVASRAKSPAAFRGGVEQHRSVVVSKQATVKARAEALGRMTHAEGPDAIPEMALQLLADPKESSGLRLAALKLLQQQQFFSTVAAEWGPRYTDALRSALDTPSLRKAALEILSLQKDRKTQQMLLDGIRNPKKALVPVHHALRLLSSDIHADVLETARGLASDKQSRKDSKVFMQALRILGSDAASVGRLKEVLADDAHSSAARRLAATALSHLSPEGLEPRVAKRLAAAKARPKRRDNLSKHIETLRSIQE